VLEVIDWGCADGVQTITHANGEAASDLLIAAHTVARLKLGADRAQGTRPVLIHGQLLASAIAARIARKRAPRGRDPGGTASQPA
jgi:predicted amidohydrolase YtcJ